MGSWQHTFSRFRYIEFDIDNVVILPSLKDLAYPVGR